MYNGIVDVEGEQVKVVNGVAEFGGEKYYISDDGSYVIDGERSLLGTIRNGKFMPVDDALIAKLQAEGGVDAGE